MLTALLINLAIVLTKQVIVLLTAGWVALVTYGEGWHNNHHAFQYSARHGLKWWEIDLTWMTIQLLQALGLATKVKLVQK